MAGLYSSNGNGGLHLNEAGLQFQTQVIDGSKGFSVNSVTWVLSFLIPLHTVLYGCNQTHTVLTLQDPTPPLCYV